MKLNRDPQGHFMESGEGLWFWLPVLLEKCYQHCVFRSCLKRLAQHCVSRAARCYRIAADGYICDGTPDEERSADFSERWHAEAQKWFRKRDIIMRALDELETLDK